MDARPRFFAYMTGSEEYPALFADLFVEPFGRDGRFWTATVWMQGNASETPDFLSGPCWSAEAALHLGKRWLDQRVKEAGVRGGRLVREEPSSSASEAAPEERSGPESLRRVG